MTEALYQQVVMITEEYLGPAAPRFVSRQIVAHIGKDPQELSIEDIPKLTEWSRLTMSLITDDRAAVAEYAQKLAELADEARLSLDGAPHNP